MKRKFTLLLMALLALTGLKGWAQQREYTYTKVTEFPSNPDPTKEYFLGYENAGTYYLYASGTAVNAMTLSSNQAEAKTFTFGTGLLYGFLPVNVAKCDNLYLSIYTSGANQGVGLGSEVYSIGIVNRGDINDGSSSRYLYHDGMIIKASNGTSNRLSFFERTGSSAPTYAVTVTSDTEGCTASADEDEYEAGEIVTLSYTADAFHTFGAWVEDYDDVTITNNQFTMPEHDVTISATFTEKTKYAIAVSSVEGGTLHATYNGQNITEAPQGLVIDLSYDNLQSGYTFDHWEVSSGTSPVQVTNNQFTMPAGAVTVSAVFTQLAAHIVTIQQPEIGGTISVTEGGVSISSGDAVYPGATLTFSNTPTTNPSTWVNLFKLDHYVVIEEGQQPQHLNAGVNSYTMPNCNITVGAVFVPLYFPTLTVTGYSANVTLWAGPNNMNLHQTGGPYNPGVAEGEYVFIVAEDVDGYRKTITWSDSQGTHDPISYPGDSRPCFVMPAYNNVTVSVQYTQIQKYNVTLNYNTAGGSIVVSPNQQVEGGTWVNITIYGANTHFTFNESALSVTCNTTPTQTVAITTVTPGYSYKFQMPEDNVTVTAEFTEDENYSVNIIKPEGCNFDVSYEYQGQNATTGNVYVGYKVYLENLVTSSGYRFDGWNVTYDDNGTDRPVAIIEQYGRTYFFMPQGPVTLTANVTKLEEHNVTIVQTMGGTITVNGNSESFQALEGSTITMSYSNLEPGYVFDRWIITTNTNTYQTTNNWFYMLDEDLSIQAQFLKESTVNDESSTNSDIPFTQSGWQWDGSGWNYVMTRSQFIIPATDLENVYDASITDMTFFTNNNALAFDATWKVYVKEVEYTQFDATYQYEDVSNMTQVYNGTMTIENNKMKVHFDTPYQYNDGNLMISFVQQTTNTEEPWAYWYGVNSTNYSDRLSFGGYGSINNYSNFLPKIMFSYKPSENPTTRYEITVNEVEGTTLSASRRLAAEGAVITLTQETSNDYTFNSWDVISELGDVTVDGNNQFTMPAADVTVSANLTLKQHYFVAIDEDMANGELSLYPESEIGYMQNEQVRISVYPNEGYKFDEDYGVKAWKADDPETTVEVTPNYSNSYSITMPEYNIVISARFIALTGYAITYHVNGVETPETVYENERIQPSDPQVPAGTSFVGWATSDIETYSTEAPSLFQTGNFPTEDLDLYAVFHYADQSKWAKVTTNSQLNANGGDRVIFVYDVNLGKVMCDRTAGYNYYFNDGNVEIEYNPQTYRYEIASLPTNAVIFTTEKSGDNWKFHYTDVESWIGETTLSFYGGSNINPALWGGDDIWRINAGYVYSAVENNYYLAYDKVNHRFKTSEYDRAHMYMEVLPEGGLDAYFTEVLSVSGNESLNEEKEVRNLLINRGASYTVNSAKLTVIGFTKNVENLAANFIFTDGAQLITDNAGVLATMKKNITGTEWYTISSPLAKSVGFTEVENLIPTYVEADNYDLYRLDEANAKWINSRIYENEGDPTSAIIANPAFTTIDKGVGYIYANNAGADHITFAGEVNVADVENVNLTKTADKGKGFNLIGNPFMQNITLANVTGTAELAGGFYVLTNQDTWAPEPIMTGTIAPLQGFLVQATTAGTATISKPTAAPSKGERSEQNTNIEMIVSNSIYRDNAFAMFGEGIGLNKINHRNAEAPMLYIPQGGEDFAIAFMNENTTLFPLNFKAMTTGKYSISLKATDDINTLVLVDNMTGVETNMLLESSYSFIGSPADKENRFTVKFEVSYGQDGDGDEHFAYQNGSELVIDGEGTLQIFDVLGRVVISEEVHGQTVNVGGLNTGAYIVRLTGESVKTQKIVVR